MNLQSTVVLLVGLLVGAALVTVGGLRDKDAIIGAGMTIIGGVLGVMQAHRPPPVEPRRRGPPPLPEK